MKNLYEIKKMIMRELEVYGKKDDLSMADIERIHKLSDTVKNIDKIVMLEDESKEMYGSSYNYDTDMYSERRYRKRDSKGRYVDRRYSQDISNIADTVNELMDEADPNEREALRECLKMLRKI